MAALRDIKRYQKSTELLIPKLPFRRLLKEVTYNLPTFNTEFMRSIWFTASAVKALQEVVESVLVSEFESKL